MEDRRKINRVSYPTKSVLVDCDTQTRYYVQTDNVSPLGMGLIAGADIPNLVGKDVIIVAETMIMYADVVRQVENEDGTYILGVNARKFTEDVLEYLFDRIVGE